MGRGPAAPKFRTLAQSREGEGRLKPEFHPLTPTRPQLEFSALGLQALMKAPARPIERKDQALETVKFPEQAGVLGKRELDVNGIFLGWSWD